uniref:Small ribosomal subunit protein uS9c n=1 Tax=Acetabularia peniculus TaxID=35862 RepID=A0A386JLJ1_ACEPE|nr:30S ribosomal protein S9 [Acetabularia peniculus]
MNKLNIFNNQDRFAIATGRRKESIAQVGLFKGQGQFIINKQEGIDYFQGNSIRLSLVQAPIELLGLQNNFNIIVKVSGGGLSGQADAIKLALARALCQTNKSYRESFKIKKYLTRNPKCKERRKYGLKKARKAPQYSKR